MCQKNFEKIIRYRCNDCGRIHEFNDITCACKAGPLSPKHEQEHYNSYAQGVMNMSPQEIKEELRKNVAFLCFARDRIELITQGMSIDAQSYLDAEMAELRDLKILDEILVAIAKQKGIKC